jgi:hypothetical protein
MKLGLISLMTFTALACLTAASAHDAAAQERWAEPSPPPLSLDVPGADSSTQGTSDRVSREGWSLGLRSGYALPFGSVSGKSSAALAHLYDAAVPIWVDIGYRSSPHFYGGIYVQYGPTVMAGDACAPDMQCHGSDLRVGFNVHYHFTPGRSFDPWIGLGAGYELANASFAAVGRMAAMTVSGFEIANVQLGGDFTIADVLRLGPFVAATLGDYSTASFEANGARAAGGIEDQALHSWLMIGLRGQYDL